MNTRIGITAAIIALGILAAACTTTPAATDPAAPQIPRTSTAAATSTLAATTSTTNPPAPTATSLTAAGRPSSSTPPSTQIDSPAPTAPGTPLPPPATKPTDQPATPITLLSTPAQATAVVALLATLPVKGHAPMTGYDRVADYGQTWTDDNSDPLGHNGCDTRQDLPSIQLVDVKIKPGTNDCVVLSGLLHDPYTGKTLHVVRGAQTSLAVQVDHVVSVTATAGAG